MAGEESLLEAVLAAPDDHAPKRVLADFLEERNGPGDDDLAHAYRWMARRGYRPAHRLRPRVRKPWAWWPEGTGNRPGDVWDLPDLRRCPHALLPDLLYRALPRAGWLVRHLYYPAFPDAVAALAEGLARLRGLASVEGPGPGR